MSLDATASNHLIAKKSPCLWFMYLESIYFSLSPQPLSFHLTHARHCTNEETEAQESFGNFFSYFRGLNFLSFVPIWPSVEGCVKERCQNKGCRMNCSERLPWLSWHLGSWTELLQLPCPHGTLHTSHHHIQGSLSVNLQCLAPPKFHENTNHVSFAHQSVLVFLL